MTPDSSQEVSPPRFTILLVSAMALSYEILLMRLFSIVQYHHFAYMVISLALLGYGASGSFLTFFRQRLLQNFAASLITGIIFFGLTAVVCFFAGQHLFFNPEEMLWDKRHWLKLFVLYILLALPFFFAANCIALTFSRYKMKISAIYAADLFGAGLGSMIVIGLLYFVFPQNILLIVGSIILLIPVVALFELRLLSWKRVFLFAALAAIPLLLPSGWKELIISPYKGLSQQMQIQGSRIIEEKSSPLGILTVVENKKVPFRYAPGLSLAAESELPEQLGVFTDGDGLSVITRFPENKDKLSHLDMVTSALPYHLRQLQNVLVLGAGAGSDMLQAINAGTLDITAVELNPQVVDLVRKRAGFSGGLYDLDNVRVYIDDARSFVAGSTKTFDLIQVPVLDSFSGATAGLYALNENYLYTKEALQEYIKHLTPDGFLCLSRWIRLPPRDTLKLFTTAVETLKGNGIKEPENHLVMVRSWQTGTLLIKKTAFTKAEIVAVKEFCSKRFFDPVFYPGMQEQEANRYNIIFEPYFYQGVVNLLGENSGSFIKRYKFNITPPTDDKPYFANFFKWQTLPELLRLKGQGGIALLDSGYLILVITLAQAIIASLIIILLPVLLKSAGRVQSVNWTRSRVALYFFSIGLGFLFLEIAFMQKYILYLGHPLFAAAAVLAIFLVFAGMGSQYAQKRKFHAIWPVMIILCLGLIELAASGLLFNILGDLIRPMKVLVAVFMLGPLAFCMGMPFPLALTEIGSEVSELVPWAWAVNGCASVIAAVLATLLAVHFGFSTVVLSSLVLYGIAAVTFPAGQKEQVGT
ncbi:MAG: SAM-dependent methyltransferase [Deltaproteobacteria bacterium]|nr:SAM-dependent methyltransferase [Deltaproteobacteria bacterium]